MKCTGGAYYLEVHMNDRGKGDKEVLRRALPREGHRVLGEDYNTESKDLPASQRK